MIPDEPLLNQLIATFNTELESLLSVITDNLQKIKPGVSVYDLKPIITEISRSGRNIKVAALSVGIHDLAEMAEYIEKLFVPEHEVSSEHVDLTFRSVDGMREVMQEFIEKKPCSARVRELLQQLQQQVHLSENGQEASVIPEFSPSIKASLPLRASSSNASEREFLKKIIATFKVELQENLIKITDGLLQLEKEGVSDLGFAALMEELFRAAHNIKGSARGVGAINVGEISHHLETLFAAIQQKRIRVSSGIVNLCLQSIDYMNEAMRCYSEEIPLSFNLQNHLLQLRQYTEFSQQEVSGQVKPLVEQLLEPDAPLKRSSTKGNAYESIRVPLRNLDRISADMDEILGVKIAIEEHYAELNCINFKIDYVVKAWKKNILSLKYFFDEDEEARLEQLFSSHFSELSEINHAIHRLHRGLRMPVNELSVLFNALQDEIRTIRLISVDTQLRYLPRLVRDLANELQKPVNFDIKNNDVKIDKLILEGLKDPIVHLLRNAIDHGIESAEQRQEAGKSLQGNIRLEVRQEDHQIIFEVSDDGAGINPDNLIRSAIEKNMITPIELEMMNSTDILDLIFRPGFSTRKVATDISGRGVGLDIVRSNLTQLKGQVSVDSQSGKGTHFFLRVPITLATERGLIVSCNEQAFVILTSSVESVLLLKRDDIVEVEGSPTVLVKQQPILLCSLAKVLHLDENIPHLKEYLSVVIVKKNWERVALLVDEIISEREVVLKPLQEPLTNMPFVIGATLMGSNQINFVLNSSEIIKKALLS